MAALLDQVNRALDTTFRNRVQMAMYSAALAIAAEAKTADDTVYAKRHQLAVGVLNSATTYTDRFAWSVSSQNLTTFSSVNISSSTNATPIVVTTASAHGLSVGDTVTIANHLTNTNANGTWVVTVVGSSTTFTINAAGNGVGGATGTAQKQPTDTDLSNQVSAVWNDIAGVGSVD